MRFFAVMLMMSVGLGCAGTTSSRQANSPEGENEEITEPQNEEAETPEAPAEAEEDNGDEKAQDSRPARKRRPKRRRHVEAPAPEPPPVARPAPPPTPVEPLPDDNVAVYTDGADQSDNALELEARRRCHWKNVPPYRPEWATAISPPLSQQRKLTSKPICPYGTPPNVLRVARQIAVQQTKLKR